MNKPPVVYLSGPIGGHTYNQADDWRGRVRLQLEDVGIRISTPMRGKDELRHKLAGKDIPMVVNGNPLVVSPTAIVTRDRLDVMSCDLMLVNLIGARRVSIGTMVELGWADAWRKPIVGVWDEAKSDHHYHPFVKELLSYQTKSLQEACDLIYKILEPYVEVK